MRISLAWLKIYLDINKTPQQLAEDLSLFGHEVDSIEKIGDDIVLDLEVTPNRGDCLSVLGIARELAALYNIKLKTQNLKPEIKSEKLDKNIHVQISDSRICPRFTARIIDNLVVGDSPKWMQEFLRAYGFRPINNIVDVTNYVMVSLGQPLHAFDFNKIKDGLMNIRTARDGEEVVTLDGQNRVLPPDAIIIEDKEKIYDLAGIMGGFKSEVNEKTKTIVLQGGIFDPASIRRTSKFLNHITDASYRYERGVDYYGTITAVDYAAELLRKESSAAKIGELVDHKLIEPELPAIRLNIKNVNKLLGTKILPNKIKDYLDRLGFKLSQENSEEMLVSVPSYRAFDIKIWQDLAEELAKLHGYQQIPLKRPSQNEVEDSLDYLKREYLKDYLISFNYSEIYSYSFTKKEDLFLTDQSPNECLEINNPLGLETQFLRPSMLASLLIAISKNPWAPEIKIFEIEKVFNQKSKKPVSRSSDSDERWQLGIAVVGSDDRDLKLRLEDLKISSEIIPVEKKILEHYKVRRPVKYVLIDFSKIAIQPMPIKVEVKKYQYRPISKYSPTVRDLAFVVRAEVETDRVTDFILGLNKKILFCENFDDFTLDDKTRNIAFHIWLEKIVSPLSEAESELIIKEVIEKVSVKFEAKLRS